MTRRCAGRGPGAGALAACLLVVGLAPHAGCLGRPDLGPVEPTPDAEPDSEPEVQPDTEPDAAPDPEPEPPFVCPPWEAPPGLGGPADAAVSVAEATRWLAYRGAREDERMEEAADPAAVRARYRVEQRWIDEGCLSLAQVVDVGRGLFLRTFTLAEGLGNDLADVEGTQAGDRPRPNLRRFQEGGGARGNFGGPDAVSCANCHWKGGLAGAGDRADNSVFLGDGDDITASDSRNPPALWGAGWAQLVADEMTADLQAQRDQALEDAAAGGSTVTVSLASKGVAFGTWVARPDGTSDASGVEGVDEDLRVKPFGWKGVFPTLRDFLLVSTHAHLGLEAEELLAEVAAGHITEVDLGTDDEEDPDHDGVTRELTEGQVTALELFLATLDAPRMLIPPEPEFAVRWQEGAALFDTVGCAVCHVPAMPVAASTFQSHTRIGGAPVTVDLGADGAAPRPAQDPAGTIWVPVFSDFKRHAMGDWLAAPNVEHGVAGDTWMTRRLWGLSQTGPWLHDASAALLDEAIAMHGGEGSEALFAATAWAALSEEEQGSLRVFLLSLVRGPALRVR